MTVRWTGVGTEAMGLERECQERSSSGHGHWRPSLKLGAVCCSSLRGGTV